MMKTVFLINRRLVVGFRCYASSNITNQQAGKTQSFAADIPENPQVGKFDITQLIVQDHREIQNAYDKLQGVPYKEQENKFNSLMWLVGGHFIGEELVLHPVLQQLGYKKLEAESRQEHLKMRKDLLEIKNESQSFSNAMKYIFLHFQLEEKAGGELEVIGKSCGLAEREKLGREFELVKELAPKHFQQSDPKNAFRLMMAPSDKRQEILKSLRKAENATIK